MCSTMSHICLAQKARKSQVNYKIITFHEPIRESPDVNISSPMAECRGKRQSHHIPE